ncbi:MAG: SAM-dependent methyltransferase [Acidobacteria bacterium]|nr:SAM-dependent methyltransferase [Acidobacteriota bacterium]
MNSLTEYSAISSFLPAVYRELDFENGDLVKVKNTFELDEKEYISKSQWLELCRYIGKNKTFKPEAIFFVENNPIIIFVAGTEEDQKSLHEIYNRLWCMANPRLLFVSTPVELNVYDLAGKPARALEELKPLETVKQIACIASELKNFKREYVESGEVFGDIRFGKTGSRADKALIRDITTVRNGLKEAGLNDDDNKNYLKYAHALIGRSIFIRYLEDRGILTPEYFYKVAEDNPIWKKILTEPVSKPFWYEEMGDSLYRKTLSNIDFTYRLYEKLAEDFNGDMFPSDQTEKKAVKREHLILLQKFLSGEIDHTSLFFWAYKFDIIPIELISNIYEELYHKENTRDESIHGTHYTPSSLVEFVLKKVLTPERLRTTPRIIDPACGSGIFLVEAFRRIVRFELYKQGKGHLSFNELENILKNQIGGIELNEEAARIAAFSLYLAFLHYQEPPDILEQIRNGNKLPNLIYTCNKKTGKKYFDILIPANAFDIESTIHDGNVRKKFLSDCADIVVGNPPWGAPPMEDKPGRESLEKVRKWCKKKEINISNNELSQAFIWKAIDLLKNSGSAALLVSSGVLLKNSKTSNRFKKKFLKTIRLQEVINFVQVRDIFFNDAISPFISIVFKKENSTPTSYIDYWTARRTKVIEGTRVVVLDKTDFKFFKYPDTVSHDIWKIYYFGNHSDHSLISGIRLYMPIKEIALKNLERKQGFKVSKKGKMDAGWLKEYKYLPTEDFFTRYELIDFEAKMIQTPPDVREKGSRDIYEGKRILVKAGISQNTIPKGQLIIRYETEKFAFKLSIACIKLKSNDENDYKILLGILWSSLARYYFFMTASRWGVWHDDVLLNEILEMPVTFPKDEELKNRIIKAVDKLRNYNPLALGGQTEITRLENELDEAIFELYMLTESECDLIRDRCKYTINSFYNPGKLMAIEPPGLKHGVLSSLPEQKDKHKGLERYLYVFLKSLNPELEEGTELTFQIIYPQAVPMIAVIFKAQKKGEENNQDNSFNDLLEWGNLLRRLDRDTQTPYSRNIYIEGILRLVTNDQIIIIKRKDERLWTRSAAYEDVEATFLQTVNKENRANV